MLNDWVSERINKCERFQRCNYVPTWQHYKPKRQPCKIWENRKFCQWQIKKMYLSLFTVFYSEKRKNRLKTMLALVGCLKLCKLQTKLKLVVQTGCRKWKRALMTAVKVNKEVFSARRWEDRLVHINVLPAVWILSVNTETCRLPTRISLSKLAC